MRRCFLIMAVFLLAGEMVFAAEESMINLTPSWRQGRSTRIFVPGVRIALPDGRKGLVETILPNGQIQTDLGVVLNPDGTFVDDPESKAVLLEPGGIEEIPVTPELVEEQKAPALNPEQEKQTVELPLKPDQTAVPEQTETPEERQLTLAQMIPLTKEPAQKKAAPEIGKPEVKQPEKPHKPETPKKAETPQKPKQEKQPEKAAPPKKAKSGEELRIPDEAIKTGNLDFLEGCWQGTRPEYYSKRTIKECFCFGANGKNGKRRVIDPIGHRNCIGSTRAVLNNNGVLSVTSSGAACDDGERWGQAEMVCRNSGQKTPCSWVFRDANNGRQSYTIPFVKVDSCGR